LEREDALLGTSLDEIVLFQTRRHSG
jgi:hypothetical protein